MNKDIYENIEKIKAEIRRIRKKLGDDEKLEWEISIKKHGQVVRKWKGRP